VDAAPQDHFAGVWARLRVKGTGISIPKHLRNRIFEPFSAMHTARHHTSSGPDSAGLGLYISRGLIDLHGGLISVESQEGGAYTEFTVLLPLSEPSPGDEIPADAPPD
jgi:two-component system sensor histidine kinase ChiS